MSATIGDTVHIRHCEWCENAFQTTNSPHAEHCSPDCYYNSKGQGAINQLKSDHRICATCFRYIKVLNEPEQSWVEEKADKEQTALDHGAEYVSGPDGEITLDITECSDARHTASDAVIGFQYPTKHTDYLYGNSGKWICECGNVDTQYRNTVLQNLELETTVSNLLDRLVDLYDTGAIQQKPDPNRFRDAFEEEERNWQFSIGVCLYD